MKNERDLLETFGDLASIGNYFKLHSIGNNLNNIESEIYFQNNILTEQNNLRKIIFDIKTKIEKINSIQNTTVKSLEILYILEYLENYKISTDSFNSFEDKEYFQKVWTSLKNIEKSLNIDEKCKYKCSSIRKLFGDYFELKINRRDLIDLILRIDTNYNKRWIYAILLNIIFIIIFIWFNIPINFISALILFSPLYVVAGANINEKDELNKKCKEISRTFNISQINKDVRTSLNLINEKIKDYHSQLVEILSVHKDFSITIPEYINQIYLDKSDLNSWEENISSIRIKDAKYFILPFLFILALHVSLFVFKFSISQQKFEYKNQDEFHMNNGQNLLLNLKQEELLSLLTQHTGHKVTFTRNGNFNNHHNSVLIAGISIDQKFELGVQLFVFSIEYELKEIYRTPILEGSFDNMHIETIELDHAGYELLYLNTNDYFLGSGGGEKFAYIIDFQKQEIFNAHLIIDRQVGITLSVSKNVESAFMRDFFFSKFSNDFPSLKVINE